MNESIVCHAVEPVGGPPQNPASPPQRILVADDEPTVRRLITEALVRSGYHVDAAEDGAVAWEAIQARHYDLLITDNAMPKVTGLELVRNMRSARIEVPVVMVSGSISTDELERRPWLEISAVLSKPFALDALLATVKSALCVAASIVFMLQLWLPAAANAQEVKQAPELRVQSTASADLPSAMTVSVIGKCEYSEDGVTFIKLEKGQSVGQGAIVRAGEESRTDLFFRRTGTTVRLQAGTEIKLEKMTVTIKDGLAVVHTLLDLRTGRIFTVVRSVVVGSTMEIRNAAGRAVVEGSGVGRYIITADGTHVTAQCSVIPLKVIGENGITVLAAGQQFSAKDGKMLPVDASLWVKDLIQLDELQAATEGIAHDETPVKP